MRISTIASIAFLACAIGSSQLASSTELDYTLSIGSRYSDNIRRVSVGEEDQASVFAGLDIDLSNETARFQGSLSGNFGYETYLDDAFDNQTVINARADAIFALISDRFVWVFEDKFGIIRRNPLSADTPGNRENVNVFSTGPDISLRLGGRTTIELGARYNDYWFEISDNDSNSLGGTIALVRALTASRSISINASTDRIEFDDTTFRSNFDRQSAFLSFNSQVSRGSIGISIGVNELHDNGEVASGTIASVSWNRKISPTSNLSLSYDQRFSDAGDIFNRYDELRGESDDGQNVIPVGDPFENRRFSLGLDFGKKKVSFALRGFFSTDEYQNSTALDSERIGAVIDGSVNFGSGWTLGARLSIENRDFDVADRKDDYFDATVSIDRQLSRKLSFSLEYLYADRSSSSSGANYVENQVSLSLSYSP